MNTRTSLGLFVVTALATRLIGGGSGQPAPRVNETRSSAARQAETAPVVSFRYSNELRERLNQRVTPEPGRNPFLYGSRASAAPAPRREEPAMEVVAAPREPPAPQIKLSGIAASQVDGAQVLTAIVIDNGTMVFAKAGDQLSNGMTVVAVGEMSITLADAAGITQTLRLP